MMNSFCFCFSEKLYIPSNLNDSFNKYWYNIFDKWNISCCSLLASRVSTEKSADCLMEVLFHVTSYFSLAAFKIFLFNFNSCYFEYNGYWCGTLWIHLIWDSLWAWVWVDSGSWWWTGRPGVLQFMGLQRVGTTERLNWTELMLPGPRCLFPPTRLGKFLVTVNWNKFSALFLYLFLLGPL